MLEHHTGTYGRNNDNIHLIQLYEILNDLIIFFYNQLIVAYSDAIWQHSSGSTLAQVIACLPDDTKPLPEPILTSITEFPMSA